MWTNTRVLESGTERVDVDEAVCLGSVVSQSIETCLIDVSGALRKQRESLPSVLIACTRPRSKRKYMQLGTCRLMPRSRPRVREEEFVSQQEVRQWKFSTCAFLFVSGFQGQVTHQSFGSVKPRQFLSPHLSKPDIYCSQKQHIFGVQTEHEFPLPTKLRAPPMRSVEDLCFCALTPLRHFDI